MNMLFVLNFTDLDGTLSIDNETAMGADPAWWPARTSNPTVRRQPRLWCVRFAHALARKEQEGRPSPALVFLIGGAYEAYHHGNGRARRSRQDDACKAADRR